MAETYKSYTKGDELRRNLFIFTLLLALISLSGLFGDEPGRVLLLNSYHKGYLWTDEITRGVEETFRSARVDLHVEYLDTKRYFSSDYFDRLSTLLELKHSSFRYDVILTSDNNAFNFFKERGRAIYGDVPLIFCGLNYLSEDDLVGITSFSGVNERADIEKNLELIESLHRDVENILIISDNTVTGSKINAEVRTIISRRDPDKAELQLVHDISAADLKSKLQNLSDNTVVYLTVFFRDSEGVFFEFDEGARMIAEASPVPVYGTWDFHLGLGIVGGYLVDGYNQGAEAARLAMQVLSGEKASSLPIVYDTPVQLFFDNDEFETAGLSPFQIPESAEVINRPDSILWKYRFQIIVALAFLLLFVLAFLAVLYGFFLSRRAEKEVRSHQTDLLKEKNYVQRIINNAPSLICGLNNEGVTVFINPVIEKISGYSEDEIIGKNFWKLFYPGDEFEQVKKLLKESVAGVVVDYEMVMTCKNGTKRTIVWNSFSRENPQGEIVGYLGFGYDITGLKAARQQLYDANLELINHKDNLEELVAERTMELQISLEHLQQTQKKLVEAEKFAALGGLVAGVAHEVNTPVGIGVTAASHLDDAVEDFQVRYRNGKMTKKEFEKFISLCSESASMILSNMRRASDLIHSFKQVAVDQSSQEIRSIDIHQYVEEILTSLQAQLRRTPYVVEVNCPEEFEITTNPGALSQILTNLIMNSLTHGFEGLDKGTISIDIRMSENNVLIIYGDTGKGIPEDHLKKIFEPFFTTRRGTGGSGLGMNIVYNLVTRSLGGQISCTSVVGEGTWFELEFPSHIITGLKE